MITRTISQLRVLRSIMLFIVLAIVAVVFAAPLFWMLSLSLKTQSELFVAPPAWLPEVPQFGNYLQAIRQISFGVYFRNTLFMAAVGTVGHILSASFIAYGFARLRFPGRDVLFVVLLSTVMMPEMVPLIPQYLLFRGLGWVNSFLPILVPAFFGFPFYIFLVRQFMLTIPEELSSAARIDGCNELGIWWRIVFPLTKSAIVVVAVLSVQQLWNEFLRPLVYLSDIGKRVLSVGLYEFMAIQSVAQTHLLMAAATIMVVPIIIFFVFLQRYFVEGITVTGLKS